MKKLNYYTFLIVTFVAVSLNAQFGISAKGGVFIPVGEFENVYTTGFGGEITFIYRTNPSFEFGITTGYSQYNADENALKDRILDDIKTDIEISTIDEIMDVEAPLNIYPFVFNIKYLFGTKKAKPYFFFEGGVFFYDQTTKANVEITNGPTFETKTVKNESSTMLGIGGGLQYRITKKLFFDISAKWSIMNNIKLLETDNSQEEKGTDKTAQTIGIIGGMSYYF